MRQDRRKTDRECKLWGGLLSLLSGLRLTPPVESVPVGQFPSARCFPLCGFFASWLATFRQNTLIADRVDVVFGAAAHAAAIPGDQNFAIRRNFDK